MKSVSVAVTAVILAQALAPTLVLSQGAPDTRWSEAEKAIAAHLAPRVQAGRDRHGVDAVQSAEYRSGLLEKRLPDYRFFVITGPYDGSSKIFAVSQLGKVVDLADGIWSGNDSGFRLRAIPEFLKAQKLPVRNAEEAVEMARLLEEVQGAASYIGFLQLNTRDFKVFDARFISRHYGPQTDWKFTATAADGGWLVKKEYVGEPAMVRAPPTYRISVDEKRQFADVVDVGRLRAPFN
jgi:hypothetical protein